MKDFKKFYQTPDGSKSRFTFTFKSPAPLVAYDREFYIQELTRRDFPQKGDIAMFAKSLPQHKELPLDSYKVRANMVISGIIYRPKLDEKTGEEHTEVFLVTSVDIGGWVPAFFVNQAAGSGPKDSFRGHEKGTIEYLNSQREEC